MGKFVKKGAFMLLVAFLAVGMANCKDDDPDYGNVTPPEVPVTNSISGVITVEKVSMELPLQWTEPPL